jgi:hypothetical protein
MDAHPCEFGEDTLPWCHYPWSSTTIDDVIACDVCLYAYNSRTGEGIFRKDVDFMQLEVSKISYFSFPTILNTDVMDAETCEVGGW